MVRLGSFVRIPHLRDELERKEVNVCSRVTERPLAGLPQISARRDFTEYTVASRTRSVPDVRAIRKIGCGESEGKGPVRGSIVSLRPVGRPLGERCRRG